MRDALAALELAITSDREEAAPAELDDETLAQLRALGYLAGRGEAVTSWNRDEERADPKEKVDLHRRLMRAQSEVGRELHAEAERVRLFTFYYVYLF